MVHLAVGYPRDSTCDDPVLRTPCHLHFGLILRTRDFLGGSVRRVFVFSISVDRAIHRFLKRRRCDRECRGSKMELPTRGAPPMINLNSPELCKILKKLDETRIPHDCQETCLLYGCNCV